MCAKASAGKCWCWDSGPCLGPAFYPLWSLMTVPSRVGPDPQLPSSPHLKTGSWQQEAGPHWLSGQGPSGQPGSAGGELGSSLSPVDSQRQP